MWTAHLAMRDSSSSGYRYPIRRRGDGNICSHPPYVKTSAFNVNLARFELSCTMPVCRVWRKMFKGQGKQA